MNTAHFTPNSSMHVGRIRFGNALPLPISSELDRILERDAWFQLCGDQRIITAMARFRGRAHKVRVRALTWVSKDVVLVLHGRKWYLYLQGHAGCRQVSPHNHRIMCRCVRACLETFATDYSGGRANLWPR